MTNDDVIFVTMTDGVIEAVETSDPKLLGLKIFVINDDGSKPDEYVQSIDCNGKVMEARTARHAVESMSFDPAPFLNYLSGADGAPPTEDEIHDAIGEWHDAEKPLVELYGWLGWTEAEYRNWVENPSAIPQRRMVRPSKP